MPGEGRVRGVVEVAAQDLSDVGALDDCGQPVLVEQLDDRRRLHRRHRDRRVVHGQHRAVLGRRPELVAARLFYLLSALFLVFLVCRMRPASYSAIDVFVLQTGTFALHTLKDNETIARLASGLRRFEMPDEFNYLKIYERVVGRGDLEEGADRAGGVPRPGDVVPGVLLRAMDGGRGARRADP